MVLLGVLALVTAVAGMLVLTKGDRTDGRQQELTSFRFEARVEVSQARATGSKPVDIVRGVYHAQDKSRWDFTYSDARLAHNGSFMLSDGSTFWLYDGPSNTYYRQPLTDLPPALRRNPAVLPSFGIVLGPLPADSLDSFLEQSRGAGNGRVVGNERLLDRPVDVVEFSSDGNPTRFWIDAAHLFVLRFESGDEQQRVEAEVTRLEYNPNLPADTFVFSAPSGASEVPPPARSVSSSGSSGVIGTSQVIVPPGFLTPSYLPAGLATIGQESTSSAGGATTFHSVRLAKGRPGPTVLTIEQQMRAGGLPQSLRTGTPASVNGNEGFRSRNGEEEQLVWSKGDVAVTLRSASLSFEELLRVAESMR
jgi:outer membrane lipoprotein-sorting protein